MTDATYLALDIDAIAASTVLIRGLDGRGEVVSGTGYVVDKGIVATCDHVICNMVDDEPIMLYFDDGTQACASPLERDEYLDSALLSFELVGDDRREVEQPAALPLSGECKWQAVFASWGYSTHANRQGLSLTGLVGRAKAKDNQGRPSIELDCNQAAAGTGTPMHGFSGSPVVVDGRVVGHIKRFLSDPADNLRPAFGKIYATPSSSVNALLQRCQAAAAVDILSDVVAPPANSAAARSDIKALNAMLKQSTAERAANEQFELQATESLIQLGALSDALTALDQLPSSLRRSQLRALGLAKTGLKENLDEAFTILDDLRAAGHTDPETAGILGGRFKDRWRVTNDRQDLEKSHLTYLEAFDAHQHFYPGINAAATALWMGEVAASQAIAQRVLAALEASAGSPRDCWHLATEAEARFLLGEREAAAILYREACESCSRAPGTVATLALQLNTHEDVLKLGRTDLTSY